jgi:hypothetical protein
LAPRGGQPPGDGQDRLVDAPGGREAGHPQGFQLGFGRVPEPDGQDGVAIGASLDLF